MTPRKAAASGFHRRGPRTLSPVCSLALIKVNRHRAGISGLPPDGADAAEAPSSRLRATAAHLGFSAGAFCGRRRRTHANAVNAPQCPRRHAARRRSRSRSRQDALLLVSGCVELLEIGPQIAGFLLVLDAG